MSASPLNYAFQPNEEVKEGFLRILEEIAQRAGELTRVYSGSMEEPIHDGRLLIKRLRALLWFARPVLTDEVQAGAKTDLREAAALLGGHRDLAVAQATLKKLERNASTAAGRTALTQTSRLLGSKAESTEVSEAKFREALKKAMGILARSVEELTQNVSQCDSWPAPFQRVAKATQAQIKAWEKAQRTGDDRDFHTWRKRAKRLFYQMELTQSTGRKKSARSMKRVDQLQNKLGEYHDDVVVESRLREIAPPTSSTRRALKSLDQEKAHLRKKAVKIARKLKGRI